MLEPELREHSADNCHYASTTLTETDRDMEKYKRSKNGKTMGIIVEKK
jgi:hypothetical protein